MIAFIYLVGDFQAICPACATQELPVAQCPGRRTKVLQGAFRHTQVFEVFRNSIGLQPFFQYWENPLRPFQHVKRASMPVAVYQQFPLTTLAAFPAVEWCFFAGDSSGIGMRRGVPWL